MSSRSPSIPGLCRFPLLSRTLTFGIVKTCGKMREMSMVREVQRQRRGVDYVSPDVEQHVAAGVEETLGFLAGVQAVEIVLHDQQAVRACPRRRTSRARSRNSFMRSRSSVA